MAPARAHESHISTRTPCPIARPLRADAPVQLAGQVPVRVLELDGEAERHVGQPHAFLARGVARGHNDVLGALHRHLRLAGALDGLLARRRQLDLLDLGRPGGPVCVHNEATQLDALAAFTLFLKGRRAAVLGEIVNEHARHALGVRVQEDSVDVHLLGDGARIRGGRNSRQAQGHKRVVATKRRGARGKHWAL